MAWDDVDGGGLAAVRDLNDLPPDLPRDAVQASCGCGDPLAAAAPSPGETVLDVGCGGGLDVILAAILVGPTGQVYGLDPSERMLARARANTAAALGRGRASILRGRAEHLPLPSGVVDVVVSNAVWHRISSHEQACSELARVCRPGGRIAFAEIVVADRDPATVRRAHQALGASVDPLHPPELRAHLAAVGFGHVEITSTAEVAEGVHAALVTAVRA